MKNTAKKKLTNRKATKRTAAALERRRAPRREDIPGISADLPDIYDDWRNGAAACKVRPFYRGADSYPFSCLRARLLNNISKMKPGDPDRVIYDRVNEFYLALECIQRGPH
jgi:hypothetical protein